MRPKFLSLDQILAIHADQLNRYGGSQGIRDLGLLKSAIAQPMAQFGGEWLHSTLHAMAAAHLFHITCNHPFIDGNKRVGVAAAIIFLDVNGIELTATEDAMEGLGWRTAEGRETKESIAEFLIRNSSAKAD